MHPKLSERLGKPVIVENRAGAGSTLGTALGAKAAPDGYTLGMPGSGSMAVSPAMYKSLPYDPVKDIVPMALVGRVPFVLIVHPSVPAKTAAELIAYAKTNKLFYASGGPGSPHHLYAELFKLMTGIEMTHVPYKGSADAIKDVVAGHVPMMFSDPAPSVPLIRGDKVRPIGVSTLNRWPVLPDIPTLNESGVPGFDAAGWFMIAGSAGTPQPIVAAAAQRVQDDHGPAGRAGDGGPHRRRAGGQPVACRVVEVHRHARRSAGARSCSRWASPARSKRFGRLPGGTKAR